MSEIDNKTEDNRATRNSDTRETNTRPKAWKMPSALELPEEAVELAERVVVDLVEQGQVILIYQLKVHFQTLKTLKKDYGLLKFLMFQPIYTCRNYQ